MTRSLLTAWLAGLLLGVLAVLLAPAHAQNAANGQTLYTARCQMCHGAAATSSSDPYGKISKAGSSNTASSISTLTSACQNNNKMPCGSPALNTTDIADLVAFIQSKNGVAPPPAGAPTVSLSGSSLAFGNVTVGTTSASMSVTLTNSGTADLNISAITPGGSNPGDFSLGGTCAVGTVAMGKTCTLSATFTPAAAQARSATVTLTSNAANSPHTLNLSGTGVAAGTTSASVAPMSVNFGNVTVGQSGAQSVTLTNTGTLAVNVGNVTINGAQMGEFSASGCANTVVAAGKTCTVNLSFKPGSAGAASASLQLSTNASSTPMSVALSGTAVTASPGTPAAVGTVSPATLKFGTQKVGSASSAQTVTVSNTGNAALGLKGLAYSGSNASDFATTGGSCATTTSLAAGAMCTVDVSFTPAASGPRSATLTVQTDAASNPTVPLSGSGATDTNGLIQLSQDGLVIDKIKVKKDGSKAKIKLRNVSQQPITVSGITFTVGKDYQIEDECTGKTLQPGKTCQIEIQYALKTGSDDDSSTTSGSSSDDAITAKTADGSSVTMGVTLDKMATSAAATPTATAAPTTGGGCTIGSSTQFDLSHLLLLFAAAAALLYRRVHAQRGKKR